MPDVRLLTTQTRPRHQPDSRCASSSWRPCRVQKFFPSVTQPYFRVDLDRRTSSPSSSSPLDPRQPAPLQCSRPLPTLEPPESVSSPTSHGEEVESGQQEDNRSEGRRRNR